MKKKTIYMICGIASIVLLTFIGFSYTKKDGELILSFEDCVQAGYPVMESYPRQCKTLDGRTFAEEIQESITYTNASSSMIIVDVPLPGAVTGKEFLVKGKARGGWYFEALFPVVVLDSAGKILIQTHAQAKEDWMTNEFVPFEASIKVPERYIGKAILILKKDNPSGMESRDASISFPFTIEY